MDVINSAVKVFDGSNSNVREWVSKIKLVAKLQNIEDVSCLLPLYLEGPAYAVYDQISDTDKLKVTKIEAALFSAFDHDCFNAYDLFRKRIWQTGESVDVYLADLKQLARAAHVESPALVYLAFVIGLPQYVSIQLRAASELGSGKDIMKAVELARILMSRTSAKALLVKSPKQFSCYLCHKNHLTNFCPQSEPGVCWKCGNRGHKFRDCSGKRQGGTSFACANNVPTSVTTLPAISIDISGHGQIHALVDTGCSQTMVSSSICECSSYDQGYVVAVDGSEVSHGVSNITVNIDGHTLDLQCFVLKEMMSDYDVILGMDVVSHLGGCTIDSNQRVTFVRGICTMRDDLLMKPHGLNFSTNADVNSVPRCVAHSECPTMINVQSNGQSMQPFREVRPPDRWSHNIYGN